MVTKLPVKNKENTYVLLDEDILQDLRDDPELKRKAFIEKLSLHSRSGYVYFQRYLSYKQFPKYETVYLHKLIAERYLEKPIADKKLFVRFIDGDPLNVQLANLEWAQMKTIRREMKGTSSTGFRGVTKDRGRFRAVIYVGDKKHDLGFFSYAEDAAEAYNEKSRELFGETGSLNVIDGGNSK
ncbi:MAG: hypothetical protein K9J17_02495 [Flavobacteriales bacterium]|nr:hypothetical protein [Flavobacteriales bacterium]